MLGIFRGCLFKCLTSGCTVLPVRMLWAGWIEECRARDYCARSRKSLIELRTGLADIEIGALLHCFVGEMQEQRQLTLQA
jgi:hypothetical protein